MQALLCCIKVMGILNKKDEASLSFFFVNCALFVYQSSCRFSNFCMFLFSYSFFDRTWITMKSSIINSQFPPNQATFIYYFPGFFTFRTVCTISVIIFHFFECNFCVSWKFTSALLFGRAYLHILIFSIGNAKLTPIFVMHLVINIYLWPFMRRSNSHAFSFCRDLFKKKL